MLDNKVNKIDKESSDYENNKMIGSKKGKIKNDGVKYDININVIVKPENTNNISIDEIEVD